MSKLVKPPLGQLAYKTLILPNSLKCLLIEDSKSPISAAAMNVTVGSISDPKDYQGLAHFCEHMLFLGSEKYPTPNTYQNMVNVHGGHTNAYTSLTDTNYYFSIKSDNFEEALDVFAQFFVSPLFNDDLTAKEMHAVDSEAAKNMTIDGRRLHHLKRHLSDPDSIYNKYSTGDMRTLNKDGIRDALLQFHQTFYSPESMCLVVYHNQSLAAIEQSVTEIFGAVPHKAGASTSLEGFSNPYPPAYRGKFVRVVPLQEKNSLNVSFILPSAYDRREDKPLGYFSHIIGHECKNGLADRIIEKSLGFGVSCGASTSKELFSTLDINVSLTEKGIANVEEVIGIIGEYLRIVREQEPLPWVHRETKAIAEMHWLYQTKNSPDDTVMALAANSSDYSLDKLLVGPYLHNDFDIDYLAKVARQLTADNAIVYLSTQKHAADTVDVTEPIYGTKYGVEKISERVADLLNGKTPLELTPLVLPSPNRFLPHDLTLKQSEAFKPSKVPEIAIETKQGRLWYCFDDSFKQPKVVYWMKIFDDSNGHYNDRQHRLFYSLWSSVFDYTFRCDQYELSLVDANVGVSVNRHGFSMSVNCFRDSLPSCLTAFEQALLQVRHYDNKEQFDEILHSFKRSTKNKLLSQPYQTASELVTECLIDGSHTLEETLQFLNQITWAKFKSFNEKLFKKELRFESLFEGNDTKASAVNTYKRLTSIFKHNFNPTGWMTEADIKQPAVKDMEKGSHFIVRKPVFLPSEKNTGVVFFYHLGDCSRRRALMMVVARCLKHAFFYELRTKQQIGYIVHAGLTKIDSVYGLKLIAQSSRYSAAELAKRIQEWAFTATVSEEEVRNCIEGEKTVWLEPWNSLQERASSHISEIAERRYDYARREKMLADLNELKPSEVIAEVKKMLTESGCLEAHVMAKDKEQPFPTFKHHTIVLKDVKHFHRTNRNVGDFPEKM